MPPDPFFDSEESVDEGFSPPAEEPQQAAAPSTFQVPEQPSFTGGGVIPGGLDNYTHSRLRQRAKLLAEAQVRPIFQDPTTGALTPQRPFTPVTMDFEGRPVIPPSAMPVQHRMAQSIDAELSTGAPMRDMDVFAGAGKIYSTLKDSLGGDVTPENYLNAPYWQNIKDAGASDEYINALQKTAWRAITPIMKKDKMASFVVGQMQEAVKDPLTSGFLDPALKDPVFAFSPAGAKAIQVAKEKAAFIREDPTLAETLQSMAGDAAEGDRAAATMLNSARASKSPSALNNILGRYAARKERMAHAQNEMLEVLDTHLVGMGGVEADTVRGAIEKGIQIGQIEDRASLSRILRSLERLPIGQSDEKLKVAGIALPSLRKPMLEAKVTNKIETAAEEYGLENVVVTPDLRVHQKSDLESIIKSDIHSRFGDTNPFSKTPGSHIALPADFFKDGTGKTVYLQAVTVGGIAVAASVIHGEMQYVPRELIKKMGLDPATLKERLTEGSYELGPGFGRFVTDKSQPYQPTYIPGTDWMKVDAGRRLDVHKAFMQGVNSTYDNYLSLTNKAAGAMEKATRPTLFGEAGKAVFRGVYDMAIAFPLAVGGGVGNSLRHLANYAISSVQGDMKAAQEEWDAARGHKYQDEWDKAFGSFPDIMKAHAERMKEMEDYTGMGASPDATPAMKAAAFTADLASTLFTFPAKMAFAKKVVIGTQAAEKLTIGLAEKMGGWSAKLKAMCQPGETLAQAAARSPEIKRMAEVQQKVHGILSSMVDMTALSVAEGKFSPTELGAGAATGLVFGGMQAVGRGMRSPSGIQLPIGPAEEGMGRVATRSPFKIPGTQTTIYELNPSTRAFEKKTIETRDLPWYPTKNRVYASVAGGGILYGMGAVQMALEGKTKEEIAEYLSNPENIANIAAMAIFGLMGQKDVRMTEGKLPAPEAVARPQLTGRGPAGLLPAPPEGTPGVTRIPEPGRPTPLLTGPAQGQLTGRGPAGLLPAPPKSKGTITVIPAPTGRVRPVTEVESVRPRELQDFEVVSEHKAQDLRTSATTEEKKLAIALNEQGVKGQDGKPIVSDKEAEAAKETLGQVAPAIQEGPKEVVEKEQKAADAAKELKGYNEAQGGWLKEKAKAAGFVDAKGDGDINKWAAEKPSEFDAASKEWAKAHPREGAEPIIKTKKAKPTAIPTAEKKVEKTLDTGVKPEAVSAPMKAHEALSKLSGKVSVEAPEGARSLRITVKHPETGKSTVRDVPIEEIKSGNSYSGSNVVKVEAGTIGKGGKFVPVKGEVRIGPVEARKAPGKIDPIQAAIDRGDAAIARANARKMGKAPSAEQQAGEKKRKDVEAAANRAAGAFKRKPKVVVAKNIDDPSVPASVRRKAKKALEAGQVATGAYSEDGKTIYVFSDHVTPEQAEITVTHELVGHHGLKGVLGEKLNSVMESIAAARPKEVEAKMRDRKWVNEDGTLDASKRAEAAEEVLCDMAERGEANTLMQSIYAQMRSILRDLGFVREWTDGDLRELLVRSRKWLKGETYPGVPEGQMADHLEQQDKARGVEPMTAESSSGSIKFKTAPVGGKLSIENKGRNVKEMDKAEEAKGLQTMLLAEARALSDHIDPSHPFWKPKQDGSIIEYGRNFFSRRGLSALRETYSGNEPPKWVADKKMWRATKDLIEQLRKGEGGDMLNGTEGEQHILFGTNVKTGGFSVDFGLMSCMPTEACKVCYAKSVPGNIDVMAKSRVRKMIAMALYPKESGQAIAKFMRSKSKGDMPFLRINGSGDTTFSWQVDLVNSAVRNLDRPVQIFSRSHTARTRDAGGLDQISNGHYDPAHPENGVAVYKEGSIDPQLVKEYGFKFLRENLARRGINNSYLVQSVDDIPILLKLKEEGVDFIMHIAPKNDVMAALNRAGLLPSTENILKKPEIASPLCPCSTETGAKINACAACATTQSNCFNVGQRIVMTQDGKLIPMSDVAAVERAKARGDSIFPMYVVGMGKTLDPKIWMETVGKCYIEGAADLRKKLSKMRSKGTAVNIVDPRSREPMVRTKDEAAVQVFVDKWEAYGRGLQLQAFREGDKMRKFFERARAVDAQKTDVAAGIDRKLEDMPEKWREKARPEAIPGAEPKLRTAPALDKESYKDAVEAVAGYFHKGKRDYATIHREIVDVFGEEAHGPFKQIYSDAMDLWKKDMIDAGHTNVEEMMDALWAEETFYNRPSSKGAKAEARKTYERIVPAQNGKRSTYVNGVKTKMQRVRGPQDAGYGESVVFDPVTGANGRVEMRIEDPNDLEAKQREAELTPTTVRVGESREGAEIEKGRDFDEKLDKGDQIKPEEAVLPEVERPLEVEGAKPEVVAWEADIQVHGKGVRTVRVMGEANWPEKRVLNAAIEKIKAAERDLIEQEAESMQTISPDILAVHGETIEMARDIPLKDIVDRLEGKPSTEATRKFESLLSKGMGWSPKQAKLEIANAYMVVDAARMTEIRELAHDGKLDPAALEPYRKSSRESDREFAAEIARIDGQAEAQSRVERIEKDRESIYQQQKAAGCL